MIKISSDSNRSLLLSIGVSCIITFSLLAAGICTYESCDDMMMIRLLSGQQGIRATPDAVFMSLPLGSLLYLLYKIYPSIPWYGLTMYGALITGCAVGLRVILDAPIETRNKIISALAFLCLYIPIASRLNFASASLLLWFCVTTRLAQESLKERQAGTGDWLYGCLLGFSYLIRPDIIMKVATLLSLPVLATALLAPSRKKRLLAVFVPLCIVIIVATVWAQAFRNTSEYADYEKFNKVRADFFDTTMSDATDNTLQALSSNGWNIFDHFLAHENYWLHDSVLFSAEKLETYMMQNKGPLISFQLWSENLRSHSGSIVVFIFTFAALLIRRHHSPPLGRTKQWVLACALAFTLFNILLLMMIRFPPRVALPVFACLILYAVLFRPFLGRATEVRAVSVSWALWIICCASILSVFFINFRSINMLTSVLKKNLAYANLSIKAVQQVAGKDVMVLNGNSTHPILCADYANPLREYWDLAPFISIPSLWLISSPSYNVFLRDHRLVDRKEIVPRMVNNPKVILAFYSWSDVLLNSFSEHLQLHYGSLFPGKMITLKTVLDTRTLGQYGWVFLNIRTLPY